MDNSALVAATRERSKSATSKPETASIGVATDECAKDNTLVREGILLELTKPNKQSSRDVKDASIQTEEVESAATNHDESSTKIEHRLIQIEQECEQRLRREMNAKLRLSAKEQAIQAMSKLQRKHRDECRSLQKQLAEERSRSKHREKELLQSISKQQMVGQKELRVLEQKLERERLEKSTLESEMGRLNDRMKELQITRFSDNEKSERALTMSLNDLEQQKRQFQVGIAEAVRERDKFQLMLARESEILAHKTKEFKQTQEELVKKLVKAESALNAKNSEATALRALLKQCQSALESLSYKDERSYKDEGRLCPNDYVPQTPKVATAPLTSAIQLAFVTNQSLPQEEQLAVPTVAAQTFQNVIEDEQRKQPQEMIVTSCNDQLFEKKHLGDPPPCTSRRDPPEETLPVTQPLVKCDEEERFPVEASVPKDIEVDLHGDHCESSTEKSLLPMHEKPKLEDTSQSRPDKTELVDNDNDNEKKEADEGNELDNKLSSEQCVQREENSSPVCDDDSSETNSDSISASESSGTDEYSMGSFATLDQKLDKQGRVSFIHIK